MPPSVGGSGGETALLLEASVHRPMLTQRGAQSLPRPGRQHSLYLMGVEVLKQPEGTFNGQQTLTGQRTEPESHLSEVG